MESEERIPTPIVQNESESFSSESRLSESFLVDSRPSTARSIESEVVQEPQVPQVRTILLTTGAKSTVHGFPTLASPKAPLAIKIIWLLSILVAWSYAVYGCYGIMKLFTKYEKATAISVVPEGKLIFLCILRRRSDTFLFLLICSAH